MERARRSGQRVCARGLTLLAMLAAVLFGSAAVAPAWACACGAYIDNGDATVVKETAALRWDGKTEDLIVAMQLLGSSPDAAWLMPVPAKAQVAVSDRALLDELAQRTKPLVDRTTSWWPNLEFLDKLRLRDDGGDNSAGAAPSPTVTVLEQRELGDYTVAQIAAKDTTALTKWLTDNGYTLPAPVGEAMKPYADANWVFIAVKLTQGAADAPPLTGALQPLRLTFASAKPIYPMLLSKVATGPQAVELYVVGAHRLDPEFAPIQGVAPTLIYADWFDPGDISTLSKVAQWIPSRSFVTRYEQTILDPSLISSDYTWTQAPEDTTFRAVTYVDRDLGWLTGALLAVLGLVLLAVIPTRLLYNRRVRREEAEDAAAAELETQRA